MKILKQLSATIVIGIALAGCSSTETYHEVGGVPYKVEKSRVESGDYTLDSSFFKKRGLPIPNSFKGKSVDYLIARNDTLKKHGYDFFEGVEEKKALKFYKDLDVRGYGDNSPYWRWKIGLDKDEFFNAIKNNLPSVYRGRPAEVLTLSNGQWKSLKITESSVGKIVNVEVAGRGKSGVVTYLLVTTSSNKYLVAKELNIRKLFSLTKTTTKSSGDIVMYGARGGNRKYQDAPVSRNISLLPSGYFAIEYTGGRTNIYGGGYGHIGLIDVNGRWYDQNGVKKLAIGYRDTPFSGYVCILRPKNQDALGLNSGDYKVGTTYTLTTNVKVRDGAGTDARRKLKSELTEDGQKNALNQTNATLKEGTRVTVQEVKNLNGDIWVRIPSGWIAAKYQGSTYLK